MYKLGNLKKKSSWMFKFNIPDMVATVGETTGLPVLKNMHHRMMQDPVGQEILQ